MIKKIINIWNKSWMHRYEVLCIYLSQLLFGIVTGGISYMVIDDHIGKSKILENLAVGFDRTVFMDILNNNDNSLQPLLKSAIIMIPVFLLLSIILQGGLLYNIKKGEVTIRSQIKNGLRLFMPFLGFALIFIVLLLVFAGLFGFLFKTLVGDPLVTFSSEKPFVYSIFLVIGILSFITTLLWSWSILTRYAYIEGISFGHSIKSGLGLVKNHFGDVILIGYLMITLHIIMSIAYYLIMTDRGAHSWLIVVLSIIIQQGFSFARIYIRNLGYIAFNQINE